MIEDQFLIAAQTARTVSVLDEVTRLIWGAFAEGHISEAIAEAAAEAAEGRRKALQAQDPSAGLKKPPAGLKTGSRSPDRSRSLIRKRRVASSGSLPPALACQFTQGEAAVLAIVAAETRRNGSCTAPIDKIAALAGVSRSTVKNALRLASRLELVSIQERRNPGWRNDTNIVTITSGEWKNWLRLTKGRGQKATHHGYLDSNLRKDFNKTPVDVPVLFWHNSPSNSLQRSGVINERSSRKRNR
jgi:hypothetical protein